MRPRTLRHVPLGRASPSRPSASRLTSIGSLRVSSSVSQRPHSEYVSFPGALKSAFTNTLQYQQPQSWTALPTYRIVDQHGDVVDSSFEPDIPNEVIVKLYTDMLYISILDVIMFDAQRQGRLSFYMVSAGEEAVSVATSSVIDREDVIFCQYREQGCFRERGFTTKQFMAQLFANKGDPGKGRQMPVHYGSKDLNIVRCHQSQLHIYSGLTVVLAYYRVYIGHAVAACGRPRLRTEDEKTTKPRRQALDHGGLLRRGHV